MKAESSKILSELKTVNSRQQKILNSYREGIERGDK